ncbi:hypothetical protein H4S02_000876 [Coemansia sp. RSA 2611]|nr:hypothetical protein H4S02_000876 [Coemansia sp. RSA 2611]
MLFRSLFRSLSGLLAVLLLCALGAAGAENSTCGPSSRYVVGYFQTWKRQSLMNIDWSKLSHLNLAYGIPTDSGDFTFDGEWFLPQLIRDAHKEDVKVSVSIGGWTGSNRMSTIMRDSHKRAALIRAIGAFVDRHELDGVDIDWEYVGRQGSKCNKVAPAEDAANLMRFLRALRASLHARFPDSEKLISLAVPVEPFHSHDGPLKDVSPYAEHVDFASIMAFDINGPWGNSTGPSAPLQFQRNRGAPFSLTQAVDQWLDAKWPADKLVAGVSFHGHSMTTRDVLTAKDHADMYTPIDKDVPQGDPEDALWYDVCENTNSMSGTWQYRYLRDQGILKTANTTGDEWIRVWDRRSATPWLYNPQMRRFISYDDPESLARKVDLVKAKNLKGLMAWSLHADYHGELLAELNRVGPLCRGPKSDSDQPQTSSEEHSLSSSSSSSWSPTAPFASLSSSHTAEEHHTEAKSEKHSEAKSEEHAESKHEEHAESKHEEHPEPKSEEHPVPKSEEHPEPKSEEHTEPKPEEHSASPENPSPASEPQASSATASATSSGKSILFDSLGAPYMMVDGQSTPMPTDLAEKLMQAVEKTTTSAAASSSSTNINAAEGSSESLSTNVELLPTAPLAIPVVDSMDKSNVHASTPLISEPNKSAPNVATNLFSTPLLAKPTTSHDLLTSGMPLAEQTDALAALGKQDQSTTSQAGFAATFFLTLDTSSQAEGKPATTVIPFSQMMASAKSSSEQSPATATDGSQGSTSDPLATSSGSPTSS